MIQSLPTEREDKRQVLLDAVESVRDTLIANAEEAESISTLPQASVDALHESGLFAMKLPEVLGGAEADPMTQLDILEAVSCIDPSAGWCLMIGATSLANLGAFLPDEAIEEIFVEGRIPKTAGVAAFSGKAVPVESGYLINGRWAFGSGVKHAQWLFAGARVVDDNESSPKQLRVAFPTSEVQIHDNWQVMGLRGTGSCDFSVSNLFVAERFTWDVTDIRPKRGGPQYLLGRPGFVAYEHAAFALGVGRRALDAVIELALSKERGYSSATLLARRSSFQRDLGECDLRLRAARALVIEILEEAWKVVCQGQPPEPRLQAEMRSSATYTTEVAAEVVSRAFRYGGGSAMHLSSVLQQCLRDINAAAQHLMVSDVAYENHGQFSLGLPEADPMG